MNAVDTEKIPRDPASIFRPDPAAGPPALYDRVEGFHNLHLHDFSVPVHETLMAM